MKIFSLFCLSFDAIGKKHVFTIKFPLMCGFLQTGGSLDSLVFVLLLSDFLLILQLVSQKDTLILFFLRAFARFALYYKSAKFEYPKANDEWMPVLKRISVSSVCLFYMSTVDYSMIVSARISCCVLGKGLC